MQPNIRNDAMTRFVRPVGSSLLLLLASATLFAQEPPPPETPPVQPEASLPVEDVAPPVAEPVPGSAEEPSVAPAKVLLVPVEFSVYEQGLNTSEIVADWTEAARANLVTAATEVLRERAGLQVVPMPTLEPAEQEVLREHLALVKHIVLQANSMSGGAWNDRKPDFDRRFGDGLQFLRERSGADFVILIDGSQVKQSGGRVVSQLALLGILGAVGGTPVVGGAPGGGTYLSSSLIDLVGGEVKWFNARYGQEAFGMTRSDLRQLDDAKVMLRKLFEPYPAIPALTVK
jgi:hypothetical protein